MAATDEKYDFYKKLFKKIDKKKYRLRMCSELFKTSKDFNELRQIYKLSGLEYALDDFQKNVLSESLSDAMIRLLHKSTPEQLLADTMRTSLVSRFLSQKDLDRVHSAISDRIGPLLAPQTACVRNVLGILSKKSRRP